MNSALGGGVDVQDVAIVTRWEKSLAVEGGVQIVGRNKTEALAKISHKGYPRASEARAN